MKYRKQHATRFMSLAPLTIAASLLAAEPAFAQDIPVLGPKPFISYFKPTPVTGSLSASAWGAATVGPRDQDNGLEDRTLAQWNYWDGVVLKGPDGRYRLFGSRWDQAKGHDDWWNSKGIWAVSSRLTGPYRDMGLLWPDNDGGRGHNVIALKLHDGTYAVVISETRNTSVFTSASIDGPWHFAGEIRVDQDAFHSLANAGPRGGDLTGPDPKPWHGSNVNLVERPGGGFIMVQRSGQILLSEKNILGPYRVMGDSIYRGLPGLPQFHLENLEDPVIWFSGGWYHLLVNHWEQRQAYHLISRNGITGWRLQGLAYRPGADFIRYTNGVVNHWNKLERPGVLLEKGHVTALTFAVIDVPKEEETPGSHHGSKIIVVPFDGAAMDRDLSRIR
jgi:hypothetical protein